MSNDITLLYCPFPSCDAARTACRALLEQKLIACGNILPMGESHYCWEGEMTQAEECILIAKTNTPMAETAMQQLAGLHPYSCPAILSFSAAAAPAFAAWVGTAVTDSILPS